MKKLAFLLSLNAVELVFSLRCGFLRLVVAYCSITALLLHYLFFFFLPLVFLPLVFLPVFFILRFMPSNLPCVPKSWAHVIPFTLVPGTPTKVFSLFQMPQILSQSRAPSLFALSDTTSLSHFQIPQVLLLSRMPQIFGPSIGSIEAPSLRLPLSTCWMYPHRPPPISRI